MKHSFIHIYTGDGKGKTSAAVGLAFRALGRGKKVFFGQFMKGRETGEGLAFAKFGAQVCHRQFGGENFIPNTPGQKDVELATSGMEVCAAALRGGYDLVVLDEACGAAAHGVLPLDRLVEALEARAPDTEVVLTGRDAPAELLRLADLVSHIEMRKHYYLQGVPAREGIEF